MSSSTVHGSFMSQRVLRSVSVYETEWNGLHFLSHLPYAVLMFLNLVSTVEGVRPNLFDTAIQAFIFLYLSLYSLLNLLFVLANFFHEVFIIRTLSQEKCACDKQNMLISMHCGTYFDRSIAKMCFHIIADDLWQHFQRSSDLHLHLVPQYPGWIVSDHMETRF